MRGAHDALLLVCQADELDQLVKGESWQQASYSRVAGKQQVSGAAVISSLRIDHSLSLLSHFIDAHSPALL